MTSNDKKIYMPIRVLENLIESRKSHTQAKQMRYQYYDYIAIHVHKQRKKLFKLTQSCIRKACVMNSCISYIKNKTQHHTV